MVAEELQPRCCGAPPEVPNLVSWAIFSTVSGPRFWNRTQSALFARCLHARRKRCKPPKIERGFAVFSSRLQAPGLPPQIRAPQIPASETVGPRNSGERVLKGRDFELEWRAAGAEALPLPSARAPHFPLSYIYMYIHIYV